MREFYFVFREPNDIYSSNFGPEDVHETLEEAQQEIKKYPKPEFKIFKVVIEEVGE